jgi:hypothetical protein
LPSVATELPGLHVWSALRELSRSRPDVAELLTVAVERERDVIAHACPALDDVALRLVLVTVEGLRSTLCAPGAPATDEVTRAAQVTLGQLLDLLGVERARAA